MEETVSEVKCPHCGKTVAWVESSAWKPFCSERCRLIDLGDWLLERNAIPAESGKPAQETSED